MKRTMFILAGMMLLLVAAAAAQTIEGSSGHFTSTITKTFALSPGGNLVMEIEAGDIHVTSWQKSSVEVVESITMKVFTRGEAEAIIEKLDASFRQEGSTLTIRNNSIGRDIRDHLYEIQVPEKFNLNLRTSGGDLEISKVDGRADIVTSGGDVTLHTLSGAIDARTSGGDLILEAISGKLNAATSGGDVEAKSIYAESSLKTSGGDMIVENSSQRLDIATSGGDIELKGIGGSFSASTSGGDITLTQFSGAQGVMHTSGGDLIVGRADGKLDLATSGGDIQCHGIGNSLRAMTSGGDIIVEDLRADAVLRSTGGNVVAIMTLQDFKVPHSLTMESMGGDIELTLPAQLPATIEAEVRQDRSGTRNDIFSDFPLSKLPPDETNNRIVRSKGEINGGGDRILLKTAGGDIRIIKSE